MTPDLFAEIVADAALSPNVHNIQPTRWRLVDAKTVAVVADPARRLPAGDPTGRDVGASHGAAVEGFILAAGLRGLGAKIVAPSEGEVVRLTVGGKATPDPLAAGLTRRRTYRGKFLPDRAPEALAALAAAAPDLAVLTDSKAVATVARLNDIASLKGFRNSAFRAELVAWMRLSASHPDWSRDGLNARAMEMSPMEAAAAGFVLRPGVFEALDRVGLAGPLTAEAAVVNSAAAVGLFHRPAGEAPLDTGRRWHRVWLEITRLGLAAAPMTVLADDPVASEAVAEAFGRREGERLITVLRIGVAPPDGLPPPARLPLSELIVRGA